MSAIKRHMEEIASVAEDLAFRMAQLAREGLLDAAEQYSELVMHQSAKLGEHAVALIDHDHMNKCFDALYDAIGGRK